MIFHIFGGQMSGKSTVAKQLDPEKFAHWDVKESFYIPQGILKNDKMDWNKWQFRESLITKELSQFIDNNPDKHIIVESSGMNKNINRFVKKLNVIPVYTGVPTRSACLARAQTSGTDPKQALAFNEKAKESFNKIKDLLPNKRTIKEAVKFIKETAK